MAWGPFIGFLIRALPDLIFIWRVRVERNLKEEIHDGVQDFRHAVVSGDLDSAAEWLERRVREARRLRQR